ncbi:FAD/NAD(P)-binding oxidoreductase, partial [Escherichia coli]
AVQVDELQRTSVKNIYAAGECTGFGGSELALIEGEIAGLCAADRAHETKFLQQKRTRWQRFALTLHKTFALPESLKRVATPETLLCRCEDIRCGDVEQAQSWLQAKLTTRCGMGACQGRTCAATARWLYGWPLLEPRAPLSPSRSETLIALAQQPPSPH